MDVVALYTNIEKTIQINAGVIVLENPVGFPFNGTNLYLIDQTRRDHLEGRKTCSRHLLFTRQTKRRR